MPFRDTIRPLASSKTLLSVSFLAAGMGVYSLLAMWKDNSQYREYLDMPSDIHAALLVVLGWLLVFRTNTAYSRWWEARTLWGTLVNTSRNLSIKLIEFGRPDEQERAMLASLIASFPCQLKDHLRGIPASQPDDPPNSELDQRAAHAPISTAHAIYRWLSTRIPSEKMDGNEMRTIDMELAKLLEVCGACERIAKTPFVRSYRTFVRQCITLVLLSFPWGIAHDFGWWTVLITVVVSYFMIGMETIAEHIEEPFGFDEDDLDLDGMCLTIERSVNQIFGNTLKQKN
jgi:putative membrane protein